MATEDQAHATQSPRLACRERVTRHACRRMTRRRISLELVDAVLDYGEERRTGDTRVYAVGRRCVQRAARRGVDIRVAEGVHVVCGVDGCIITVFRDRALRTYRRARRWQTSRRRLDALRRVGRSWR